MSEETHALALIASVESVKAMLRTADLREVVDVKSKAEAAKMYASKHKHLHAASVQLSEISIRASRRAGEILSMMPKNKGGPCGDTMSPQLAEVGVTKKQSSRWQQIARIPAEMFESFIAKTAGKGKHCTANAAYKLAPIAPRVAEGLESPAGAIVTGLFADLTGPYSTIYADPPWQYGNQATRAATDNHYQTMGIAEICDLPVRTIAAGDAQLHLWTTNGFLREAFDVIDAWGFEYRSTFVWCKTQLGIGNYWRVSHEFLLLGVRGSATFKDKTLRSWAEIKRGRHSAKPDAVRDMVERAGCGPRLELFGREAIAGWTVFGNQVERTLLSNGESL